MKLPCLLVTDTHFTDSPSDEYRWGLWPWLREQIALDKVKTVCHLGDLTDAKDYHSSELTNRIAREVQQTAALVERFNIIAGNHDWLRGGHEFFRFLAMIPQVRYFGTPGECDVVQGPSAYFLPYSKNPAKAWAGMDFADYDYLFMHQTLKGARSSNGQLMDGEALPRLNARKVYSGDIHVPQVVRSDAGEVEYVGSPYHVHFGDRFKPRCVLIEQGGHAADLHFETVSRTTIDVSSLAELRQALRETKVGDEVKVRMTMTAGDQHDWSRLRREIALCAQQAEVALRGAEMTVAKSDRRILNGDRQRRRESPEDAVMRYCEAESLPASAFDAALEILG